MEKMKAETATFGAGCFWGVELMFSQVPGVLSTAVGYMGGDDTKTTYEEVCSDETGHAEVVHLTYDPSKVNYETLLKLFWDNHNPTTPNRQGPDVGSQYRSVVFYHTPEQKRMAEKVKQAMQEKLKPRTVVTQIVPAKMFHRAEEYHQQYLKKKGLRSCHI